MKIDVYSDGSATTKDKPGGYGWVIIVDGKFLKEGSGSIPNATNNDAELEGAIMGLAHALQYINANVVGFTTGVVRPLVTLCSDSEIVLGWVSGRYRFKQIQKITKYESLRYLVKRMSVLVRWVEGHTGDTWNERCDQLAGVERKLAMGIQPKKRVDKSKILKEACKKMAETLKYIKLECEDLKHRQLFVRDDFIDQTEDALAAYADAIGKLK